MFADLEAWVLRVLRVPPEPSAPAGSTQARVFRAAPNFYRYRLVVWLLSQLVVFFLLMAALTGIFFLLRQITDPFAVFALRAIGVAAMIAYVVQLPISLAVLHLDYEFRWYILADRSLRIREGILSLREKTMTFANIQQIEIRQNPLQRLLAIADVRVRTAGGGGGGSESEAHLGESMHEASFRGVADAEAIRLAIAERVRIHRDSGLGDPDDVMTPHPAVESGPLSAAHELRDEARLLRLAMQQSAPPHPG